MKKKRKSQKGLTKSFISLLLLIIPRLSGFSQSVSINTTAVPPVASAGLEVTFTSMGLLIPRVTLDSTVFSTPLPGNVAGMIVYNTATIHDVTPGFYFNTGLRWVPGPRNGNSSGEMLYWNGSGWALIPPGSPGQRLQMGNSGIPVWK